VAAVLGWLMPATRKLLRSSLERYVRRNASTTLIFSIIIAILRFFSSFFAAISGSIDRTVSYQFGSDVRVIAQEPVPASVVRAIEGADYSEAVAASTASHRTSVSDVIYTNRRNVDVRAVTGDLVAATFASDDDVYRGRLADIGSLGTDGAVISRGLGLALKVGLGDTVVVEQGRDRFFLRVVLVLESLPGFPGEFPEQSEDAGGSTVLVPMEVYAALEGVAVPDVGYDAVFVSVVDGRDLDEVARNIQQRYRVFYEIQVFVPTTLARYAEEGLGILNTLFYVILTLLLLVALFSLVANLLASVLEREYELGVVRALGLRSGALRRSLMAEGATIALAAMAAGVVVGTTLSVLIIAFFNMLSPIDFAYQVPWASLAYLLGLTMVLSVVGTYSPARSVSRRPVVDLLRRAT
jgi:ABC-type antimicrobial peptide transport system permease subunit